MDLLRQVGGGLGCVCVGGGAGLMNGMVVKGIQYGLWGDEGRREWWWWWGGLLIWIRTKFCTDVKSAVKGEPDPERVVG